MNLGQELFYKHRSSTKHAKAIKYYKEHNEFLSEISEKTTSHEIESIPAWKELNSHISSLYLFIYLFISNYF
jgi:hypothetical protein